MITIKVDASRTLAMLGAAQKQVKFATAVGLTRAAKDGAELLKRNLRSALPGASPYSLNSTYLVPAKPVALRSVFGIKDLKPARGTSPAVLLKEHFRGGVRGGKPMEVALAAIGAMPDGWRVIPGAGMKLDSYGNPRRGEIGEIIGALKTRMATFKGRGKAMKTVGYFVIAPGAASHLAPGIYRRINQRAIVPMLLFVRVARYEKRIDMNQIGQRAAAGFRAHFDKAFAQAMATAR